MRDWREAAACAEVDGEFFFPEPPDWQSTAPAKKMCRESCEVREACLQYALVNKIHDGVWGGYAGYERKAMRAKKRAS